MTDLKTRDITYGSLLSEWRRKRRYSQLSFGLMAGVSPRHVSFLESGRARPSRNMVLKLAECLTMPKAETNRALLLAGFSPAFLTRSQSDVDLAPIQQAISVLLENHMPYPAITLDRLWNIRGSNSAAMKLLVDAGFSSHSNLLEALASQSPKQSSIVNWQENIGLLLMRLQAELLDGGNEPEFQTLVDKLIHHFERYKTNEAIDHSMAVIPTRFRIDGETISVFSTVASFGTVQDVVLDDLKVELMFPLDEVSKAYFQGA